MKLYDQIFDAVKQFKKLFSPGPVTNVDVSGIVTAEIFLIISIILATMLLRHVSVLLTAFAIILVAVVLIMNIPLIPKFKIEQEDSLEKMLFYAVITLGIVGAFLYWGGSLV
ncbi:hydrogenase [Methanobrevibacter sp.]|uniref:hydrogenase n=1 Tax=Methanobrevibacter sp. TaxID=66852 RepID=UPI0026E0F9AF|nr:hydrogenase [Methanobrevibacter sp.]MDO5824504.1 hydrogenase [Methanobrevibacter sp.]